MGWRRVAEAELPQLVRRPPGSTSRPTPTGSTPTSTSGRRRRGWRLEYVVLGQQFAGLPGRAVDAGRLPGLAQGDGLGPAQQLRRRADPGPPGRVDQPSSRLDELFPAYPLRSHQPILSDEWTPGRRRRPADGQRRQAASATPPACRRSEARSALGLRSAVSQRALARSSRRCSAAATASAPTPGWSPAAGPAPASRCWPTTRTSGPASRASGTRPGCTAAPSAPPARSTSPASPSPGCPASSSATTSESPGASPTSAPTSATSTSSRSGRHLPARRPLRAAARARTETIKVAGGKDVQITSAGPCTARSSPTWSTDVARAGATAPVEGKARRRRVRRVARLDRAAARTHGGRDLRPRHGPDFPQFQAAARDFAVPAQNLVYADVDGPHRLPGARARSRSGRPRRPAPRPATGRRRAGSPGTTGRATCRSRRCRRRTTRRRGSSSRPTRPSAPSADAVPHHRVGLRLPQPADPRPASRRPPKVTPGADVADPDATTATGSRRRWSRRCCGSTWTDPYTQDAQNLLRDWDFTQPTGQSDQAAAAAYYNAVWSQAARPHLQRRADRRHPGRRRRPVDGRPWPRCCKKPNDPWWDNKQTPGVIEGRDEILRQAMVEARLDLTKRLGKNAGRPGSGAACTG